MTKGSTVSRWLGAVFLASFLVVAAWVLWRHRVALGAIGVMRWWHVAATLGASMGAAWCAAEGMRAALGAAGCKVGRLLAFKLTLASMAANRVLTEVAGLGLRQEWLARKRGFSRPGYWAATLGQYGVGAQASAVVAAAALWRIGEPAWSRLGPVVVAAALMVAVGAGLIWVAAGGRRRPQNRIADNWALRLVDAVMNVVSDRRALGTLWAWSALGTACRAIALWACLEGVGAPVGAAEALALSAAMDLALLAAILPWARPILGTFAVVGVGALLGVGAAPALAASLAYWAVVTAVSLAGGAVAGPALAQHGGGA